MIKKSNIQANGNLVLLCKKNSNLKKAGLSDTEAAYVVKQTTENEKHIVLINRYPQRVWVVVPEVKKQAHYQTDEYRKLGASVCAAANDAKLSTIYVTDVDATEENLLAFTEGVALANYRFNKYKTDKKKEQNSLSEIFITNKKTKDKALERLNIVIDATCKARTLVNEPVIHLTAEQLSKEFQSMGKEAGFTVEVLSKSKIEALKMGGLLAVNYGSPNPPTFTIMEYKPRGAKNKKPYVLVGKGVVYDTGGLSLKPTAGSMDTMKCDMAGAAAVGSTMYAIAKAKLPVWVIGLTPATDNRPGQNAYTPGDVIHMHNGTTVEVLNTDAEGRMILADALSYAKKYDPQLVIDLATLTGAALAAIGKYGIVCMGTADEATKNKLKASGNKVFERLVEFPFWEEYGDLIKSEVADIKNIGGPYAGSITAGKFLEKFISYPWMHFDIAGPAFLSDKDSYKPYGGTGVGVRLLFDFFQTIGGK